MACAAGCTAVDIKESLLASVLQLAQQQGKPHRHTSNLASTFTSMHTDGPFALTDYSPLSLNTYINLPTLTVVCMQADGLVIATLSGSQPTA